MPRNPSKRNWNLDCCCWRNRISKLVCALGDLRGSGLQRGSILHSAASLLVLSCLQRSQGQRQHFAQRASPPSCLQQKQLFATLLSLDSWRQLVLQNHNVCRATAGQQLGEENETGGIFCKGANTTTALLRSCLLQATGQQHPNSTAPVKISAEIGK